MQVNKRLREAAKAGSEVKVKALLRNPGCDVLVKDAAGWTALMWAAHYGHETCVGLLLPESYARATGEDGLTALMHAAFSGNEACVRLLLPVSDALVKTSGGLDASDWARTRGHESLSQFIDAYVLSMKEAVALSASTGPGVTSKSAPLRV